MARPPAHSRVPLWEGCGADPRDDSPLQVRKDPESFAAEYEILMHEAEALAATLIPQKSNLSTHQAGCPCAICKSKRCVPESPRCATRAAGLPRLWSLQPRLVPLVAYSDAATSYLS